MDPVHGFRDHLLTADETSGRTPPLGEAVRDFEALLLGTLLRAGTKPLAGRTLLDGGSAGRMYREMLLQELARQATRSGGFGLGRLLDGQLAAEASTEEREEP